MTKDEFIFSYCERAGVTWDWLSKYKIALHCACGEDICKGWSMVSNNEDSIRSHMELYAPIMEKTSNVEITGRGAKNDGDA